MTREYSYSKSELQPIVGKELRIASNFAPNLTISKGQLMALITLAAVTATYTLTVTSTPTGTFRLAYRGQPTAPITYSGTAATLRENIRIALEAHPDCKPGDWTISGTGPFTITGTNELAGLPIEAITVHSQSLSGGSVAMAAGVTGVAGNRWTTYDGTLIAAPTTAPTPTGTGAAGSWAAGAYSVSYTYVNSVGESTPSYPATIALTAGQSLRIAAITSIPDGVTHVQIYVNGQKSGAAIAVTANATAQTDQAAPGNFFGTPPRTSTLYVDIDGSQICGGIAPCDFRTNHRGDVIKSTSDNIVGPETSSDVIRGGAFDADLLIGLTASAVADMGAKWRKGSLGVAGSVLDIPFSPVN